MQKVEIYDTTLRDGAQAEDVSFSVEDKLRIVQKLDELGVPFIEGGWPGANPRDIEFFKRVREIPFSTSQLAAFGSTRKAENPPEKDPNLQSLLEAGTVIVTIFGKSWNLHVTDALGITLDKNLEIITDSIEFLLSRKKEVFYDAEHFFDGYKADPDYAIRTLKAAETAGARRIILCDTNGGTMPWEVRRIFEAVTREVGTPLGIHAHNDAEMAVANSLVAVEAGAVQVQGTVNGFGERCGNANLCSVVPNLKIKMNVECLSGDKIRHLRDVSRFVSEIANLSPNKHQPFVGDSAFAHKGGVHVHAVKKNPLTYEHIDPKRVGNRQRILISDYAGRSALSEKARELGLHMDRNSPKLAELLKSLKELEHQGYQFEGAEGSLEVLVRKAEGRHRRFFDLLGFRVIIEKRKEAEDPISEATIMVKVGEHVEHTAAVGNGPVNALDNALRKALEKFYPQLKEVSLIDYKVRVLAANRGTSARVRVLIESGDRSSKWGTVGVSENIIEASYQALVDSIEYKLLREEKRGT
jgi:2-isopropylmalate synthase